MGKSCHYDVYNIKTHTLKHKQHNLYTLAKKKIISCHMCDDVQF